MQSSKTFVMVDRPFWKDKDPETGRDLMSMTLTDRLTRGTYLFDNGDDATAVELILLGGKGNISVTANVAPRDMSEDRKSVV